MSRWRRLCKLRRHPQLRALVIDRLKARWSPEQIAGRLLADGVSPVLVCPETIYRFIYGKEDYALELCRDLPEGRRRRRRRGSRKPRDGLIPFDCTQSIKSLIARFWSNACGMIPSGASNCSSDSQLTTCGDPQYTHVEDN